MGKLWELSKVLGLLFHHGRNECNIKLQSVGCFWKGQNQGQNQVTTPNQIQSLWLFLNNHDSGCSWQLMVYLEPNRIPTTKNMLVFIHFPLPVPCGSRFCSPILATLGRPQRQVQSSLVAKAWEKPMVGGSIAAVVLSYKVLGWFAIIHMGHLYITLGCIAMVCITFVLKPGFLFSNSKSCWQPDPWAIAWGSKGKEFEQLIAGALDFANDLQFEGWEHPDAGGRLAGPWGDRAVLKIIPLGSLRTTLWCCGWYRQFWVVSIWQLARYSFLPAWNSLKVFCLFLAHPFGGGSIRSFVPTIATAKCLTEVAWRSKVEPLAWFGTQFMELGPNETRSRCHWTNLKNKCIWCGVVCHNSFGTSGWSFGFSMFQPFLDLLLGSEFSCNGQFIMFFSKVLDLECQQAGYMELDNAW